jgi:hypothetical protein
MWGAVSACLRPFRLIIWLSSNELGCFIRRKTWSKVRTLTPHCNRLGFC